MLQKTTTKQQQQQTKSDNITIYGEHTENVAKFVSLFTLTPPNLFQLITVYIHYVPFLQALYLVVMPNNKKTNQFTLQGGFKASKNVK